jgi:hypothetical protein
MGRLIEPQPVKLGTPPGMASVFGGYRNGDRFSLGSMTYADAREKLCELIEKRNPEVSFVTLNYKRPDGSAIDAIKVDFMEFPKVTWATHWHGPALMLFFIVFFALAMYFVARMVETSP